MQSKDIGTHIVYSDGRIFKKKTNRFIGFSHNQDGYVLACLNSKQYKLHRIIAECFIPNPENKPMVNHKNGIKTDNNVDNLEWCTSKENVVHAFNNGLMVRHKGSKNHQSKLSDDDVSIIKKSIQQGITMARLAKNFNVSLSCIYRIKKGLNWSHIVA